MELFRAHHQWATRPDDERFASIQAMRDACFGYQMQAAEAGCAWSDLRVEAADRDMLLTGKSDRRALISHWAFGQLSARAEAPAKYLRTLPTTLAAQNLNHGLGKRADGGHRAELLFHGANGDGASDLVLRAATTDVYTRVWNYEVADRLLDLEDQGWEPALPDPAATIMFERSMMPDLYASDHDMFAFLVAPDRTIKEAGSDQPLYRGAIFGNSEVGASSLWAMHFLYRRICGNHIIWGASEVSEIRIRHVGGGIHSQFTGFVAELRKYLDSSVSDDEAMIAAARTQVIGKDKKEVLDVLFGQRKFGMSRKLIDAGYEAVVPEEDGEPNTKWGLAQGITRHARTIPFADKRREVDNAAGRLLRIDF